MERTATFARAMILVNLKNTRRPLLSDRTLQRFHELSIQRNILPTLDFPAAISGKLLHINFSLHRLLTTSASLCYLARMKTLRPVALKVLKQAASTTGRASGQAVV